MSLVGVTILCLFIPPPPPPPSLSLQSSVEEMIASTAYLDLFLRSVTETALLKTFLRFILLHRHDNDTILNTLLARISSNSRVSEEGRVRGGTGCRGGWAGCRA